MTKTTEVPETVTHTDAERDEALAALQDAFTACVVTYDGNEPDALHDLVYSLDPTTRVRALYRVMSDNAELGQPSTVDLHMGGYEYHLVREAEGKPETRIIAPFIDVYDINGVKYARDGYGVKRGKGADETPTAPSMTSAIARVASNVGRMGLRIAEAALVPHVVEESDGRADKKPRAASGTSKELAELRAEMAKDRALLTQLLETLTAK